MRPKHPTVVIPGFMKAGTTTLHAWLSAQPEFSPDGSKEPNYLISDRMGVAEEQIYLREIGADKGMTIDASVSYLDPAKAVLFSGRLAELNPDAVIIIAYRHPIERSISHILHDVRKNRISARSAEDYAALIASRSVYFQRSRVGTAIRPVLEHFAPQQVAVVSLEADDQKKWSVISRHVSIPDRPVPEFSQMNRASDLPSYSRLMRIFHDAGLRRVPSPTPRWLRWFGRRALLREPSEAPALAEVSGVLSSDVLDELVQEAEEFMRLTRECAWAEP
jgi:hypothetical protein